MSERGLLLRWLRATSVGWLLGIPIIVVLALIGEAVGIGGLQVLVGAGVGAGVGLMQARVVRAFLPASAPWFLSCLVGLAAPFLVTDIARAGGRELAYSLPASVALGGLVAGAWQALLLRPRFRGAGGWVVASALGWALAALAVALADAQFRSRAVPGLAGALAYLGLVAVGGVILGAVTGPWLARMVRQGSSAGGGDDESA